MTAILGKILFYLRHGIIHVIGLYGSSGTLNSIFSLGQNEDRMMVFFSDFSGNNTSNALMYLRQIDHHNFIFCHMMFLNILIRSLNSLYCQVLAALIQVFQLSRRSHGIRPGKALQQFQCPFGSIQSSRGIQAGSQHKSQMIGAQPIWRNIIHFHQRLQAFVISLLDTLQPFLHQNAILIF